MSSVDINHNVFLHIGICLFLFVKSEVSHIMFQRSFTWKKAENYVVSEIEK